MNNLNLLAEALCYPYPEQLDVITAMMAKSSNGPGKKMFDRFMQVITSFSLDEREELYTRTLDLNPLAAPYIGYQLWQENYKRGEFMAALNHEMKPLGVDKAGELPDHLIPVLRYLAVAERPLPDLLEALPKALAKMRKDLKKAEAKNPYLYLLAAISQVFESHPGPSKENIL